MNRQDTIVRLTVLAVVSLVFLLASNTVAAHCDGLDGPVVKAARQALDSGNVNGVLIWVQKNDEAEIKSAFQKAVNIRKLSPAAREMADNYFFETLVRVHRAGEGAPFTGLKPAGRDLGPAVPAGDKAVETGSVEPVVKLLSEAVQKGLREQFKVAMSKKNFNKDNVEAGRQYVGAYVEYIHYVERLYEATRDPAHGHFPEAGAHAHKD
jgi:hypothetical protein